MEDTSTVTTIIDEAAFREVSSAKRSLVGVDDSVPTYHFIRRS